MRDKLQEYALIAEILSAFAVVASLVFVGLQIRQQSDETALNTRAVEITAYQNLIQQIGLLNTLVIESGEFARIRQAGLSGSDYENEEDQSRFDSYVNLLVRHGDLAYRQFESGLITDDDLQSVLRPLTLMITRERVRQGWEFLVPGLKPEYVDYVNALVEGDT
jgi:hypothetical protein